MNKEKIVAAMPARTGATRMPRKTIKHLQAEIENSNAVATRLSGQLDVEREARKKAELALAESRTHFDDVKQRLHAAETSNQFMRGYLARVAEDDVVREELVTIGEPGGEQRMVPKRKPTEFPRPSDFTHPEPRPDVYGARFASNERPNPHHWITY